MRCVADKEVDTEDAEVQTIDRSTIRVAGSRGQRRAM